jgi:hypothetical protein
MGLFGFGRHEEAAPKNPLDCTDRPLDWFFSKEGEACWEEAKKHEKEMVDDFIQEGKLQLDAIDKYNDYGYKYKPLYPSKFVAEYFRAYFDVNWRSSTYANATLVNYLACLIGDAAATWLYSPEEAADLRYPQFLQEEHCPLFYYYTHADSKRLLSMNLDSWLLHQELAWALVNYVRLGQDKGLFLSQESWLYDDSIFYKSNIYDSSKELMTLAEVLPTLRKVASHPEFLPKE